MLQGKNTPKYRVPLLAVLSVAFFGSLLFYLLRLPSAVQIWPLYVKMLSQQNWATGLWFLFSTFFAMPLQLLALLMLPLYLLLGYRASWGKWLPAGFFGIFALELFIKVILLFLVNGVVSMFTQFSSLVTFLSMLAYVFATVSVLRGMTEKLPLIAPPALAILNILVTFVSALPQQLTAQMLLVLVINIISTLFNLAVQVCMLVFALTHQISKKEA